MLSIICIAATLATGAMAQDDVDIDLTAPTDNDIYGDQDMEGGYDSVETGWLGRLESRKGGCTVSLIDPQWILTASHCVTEMELTCKNEDCIADSVYEGSVFMGGVNGMFSGYDGEIRAVDYIAIPDGDADGSLRTSDIALLHLNDMVYTDYYPKIATEHYSGEFSMKGYGKDGNDHPVLQQGDNIQQTSCDGDVGYLCYERNGQQAQSDHGDSGGPAFITDSDGMVTIVGTVFGKIRMLGANIDISLHADWIHETVFAGPKYCRTHCSGARNSEDRCDTNRHSKCDDICECPSEPKPAAPTPTAKPSRTPAPSRQPRPSRTPTPTPSPKAPAHRPVVEHKPIVEQKPAQTSGCDHRIGERQATVQWRAWRYLQDCDLLDHFRDTALGGAPSDACAKEGFELKVQELYEAEKAKCNSRRRTVQLGTDSDDVVTTCAQRWSRSNRSSGQCGAFQAEKACCAKSHQCNGLPTCSLRVCCQA